MYRPIEESANTILVGMLHLKSKQRERTGLYSQQRIINQFRIIMAELARAVKRRSEKVTKFKYDPCSLSQVKYETKSWTKKYQYPPNHFFQIIKMRKFIKIGIRELQTQGKVENVKVLVIVHKSEQRFNRSSYDLHLSKSTNENC